MESRDERANFRDSDSTQDDRSGRPRNSRDSDEEKVLLLGEGSETVYNRPFWTSPLSTMVLLLVTALNVVLFLMSAVILLSSNTTRRESDQDHWRATSYYCAYIPPRVEKVITDSSQTLQLQYSTASTFQK